MDGPEFHSVQERQMCDNMANLYAIVRTMNHVEVAFMRDAISYELYVEKCQKLIANYKTACKLTETAVTDVRAFMKGLGVDASVGLERLEAGVPYSTASLQSGDDAQSIAVAATSFITAMDCLKLNMIAVDEVHPLILDIYEQLEKISRLDDSYLGTAKLKGWIDQLEGMKAEDELSESDQRQLLFDLERAHTEFINHLHK